MDQKILKQLEEVIREELKNVATKDDLKKLVTKEDLRVALDRHREDISEDFGKVINDLLVEIDKTKADRADLEALEERVEKIEQKISN